MAQRRKPAREADSARREGTAKTAAGATRTVVGGGALDALKRRAEEWGLILHARPAESSEGEQKGDGGRRGRGR